MHYDVAKCHNLELIQTQRLLAKFLTLTSVAERVEQGYANGGPRSESGPLHSDARTSSASQKCILYTQKFLSQNFAILAVLLI